MRYIDIKNGLPIRSQGRNGKGHLHAVIGAESDGTFVEQSRVHGQIVQRVLRRNGELVITCFTDEHGEIRKQSEITIRLWKEKEYIDE